MVLHGFRNYNNNLLEIPLPQTSLCDYEQLPTAAHAGLYVVQEKETVQLILKKNSKKKVQ